MTSLRLISDSVCVCAAFVQGEVVRAKASKIVAGQEAKKTNEFLQLLSIAILKKVSIIYFRVPILGIDQSIYTEVL